jgi:dihydrofolate reductase
MKITAHTFTTIDGVMQGPGGAEEDTTNGFSLGGWVVPWFDDAAGAVVGGWFAADAEMLLGHTTYNLFRSFWPQIVDESDVVAKAINSRPKYVAATGEVVRGPWADTTTVLGDVVAELTERKQQGGADLQIHGSHGLLQTLHGTGLIDEYHVIVFPVVLGTGKRLFDTGTAATGFDVLSQQRWDSGLASMILQPKPFRAGDYQIEDGREITVLD